MIDNNMPSYLPAELSEFSLPYSLSDDIQPDEYPLHDNWQVRNQYLYSVLFRVCQ